MVETPLRPCNVYTCISYEETAPDFRLDPLRAGRSKTAAKIDRPPLQ